MNELMNKLAKQELYEYRAREKAWESYIGAADKDMTIGWVDDNWMDFLTDKERELF